MDNPHGRQPQGAFVGPHAPADYDLALQKEKTQQEHLKLERIRTTKDILETCLNRGVPPTPWVAGDPGEYRFPRYPSFMADFRRT